MRLSQSQLAVLHLIDVARRDAEDVPFKCGLDAANEPKTAAEAIAQSRALEREVMHQVTEQREGFGLDGKARKVCSCTWKGPWRYEASDSMCSQLRGDEQWHLNKTRGMA